MMRKSSADFLLVETGGGLVEDQHLAGEIDGTGDGDHLLDGDGETAELGGAGSISRP